MRRMDLSEKTEERMDKRSMPKKKCLAAYTYENGLILTYSSDSSLVAPLDERERYGGDSSSVRKSYDERDEPEDTKADKRCSGRHAPGTHHLKM